MPVGNDDSAPTERTSDRWALALLAAAVVVMVVASLAQHHLLHRTPAFEETHFTIMALEAIDERTGSSRIDIPCFDRALDPSFYPPVYIGLLSWTHQLLGPGYGWVLLPNLCLGLLALLALFRCGTLLADRWTGACAAWVLATLPPFIEGVSGSYVDFAMACWAAAAFWGLVSYRRSGRWWALVGWSAAIAIGLLTRWTLAVFVVSVLLGLLVVEAWRSERADSSVWTRLVLPGLAAGVGALPFLAWSLHHGNTARLLGFLGGAGETDNLTYGQSLLFYLEVFFGPHGALWIGLVALVAALASRPWRRSWSWALVAWIVVGLAVFSYLERVKEVYVLFVFPAIALLLAICLGPMAATRRAAGLALVIGLGLFATVWSVRSASSVDRRVYDDVLEAVDRDWRGEGPPTVAVLYGFHPDETALNAMIVAAANAQGGHAPKTLYTPPDPVSPDELTGTGYRGRDGAATFDYAIVPLPDGPDPSPGVVPSWTRIHRLRFDSGRPPVSSVVEVYRVGAGSER